MNRKCEVRNKLDQIEALLERKSQEALLITEQSNFSWLTGGGRGFLGLASTKACASLLITKKGAYLLANNIEGKRLMEEEGLGFFCELIQIPWQQDGTILELAKSKLGVIPVPDTEWKSELDACRRIMSIEEKDRYLLLCEDAAQAMEETMKGFFPGISEFEAAGRISSALWSRGIEPISLFAAADDRVQNYRHFIPTEKTASNQMIISICGRKGGLVASVTRTVAFGSDIHELETYYYKLLRVESAAWNSLKRGCAMSKIYQAMCSTYSANGLDKEWNNHHQGGLTGYMPREIRIDAMTNALIQEDQAFAFNPSCRFAKVEDTVLLTSEGVRLMSHPSQNWPTLQVDGYLHPDILKNYG